MHVAEILWKMQSHTHCTLCAVSSGFLRWLNIFTKTSYLEPNISSLCSLDELFHVLIECVYITTGFITLFPWRTFSSLKLKPYLWSRFITLFSWRAFASFKLKSYLWYLLRTACIDPQVSSLCSRLAFTSFKINSYLWYFYRNWIYRPKRFITLFTWQAFSSLKLMNRQIVNIDVINKSSMIRFKYKT